MGYIQTEIEDVWAIELKVFNDARDYFIEVFKEGEFRANIGSAHFMQDNESRSSFGILCGPHCQKDEYSQTKLVRVIKGKALDVVVDLRQSSPIFGKYASVKLGEEDKRQFSIPCGPAHGFLVLSEETIFIYKMGSGYTPQTETSVRFSDETVGIDRPVVKSQLLLSEKDEHAISFKDTGYLE